MNPAEDAKNLVDYLHLRHACDIPDRAGRGTLRAKFGWSKERYSNALAYAMNPQNGPMIGTADAVTAPLVPLSPPSAEVQAIIHKIAQWSVEMARTSRKRTKLDALLNAQPQVELR